MISDLRRCDSQAGSNSCPDDLMPSYGLRTYFIPQFTLLLWSHEKNNTQGLQCLHLYRVLGLEREIKEKNSTEKQTPCSSWHMQECKWMSKNLMVLLQYPWYFGDWQSQKRPSPRLSCWASSQRGHQGFCASHCSLLIPCSQPEKEPGDRHQGQLQYKSRHHQSRVNWLRVHWDIDLPPGNLLTTALKTV